MNIGAIGAAYGHVKPEIRTTKDTAPETIPADNQTTPAAAEPAPVTAADAQKGVIRNLLAGHFKGVADVRLRINFHEDLTQIEQAARSASIEGQADTFVSIARDGLDLMPAETLGTAVTAIMVDYKESIQTAFAEFGAEPTVSPETLSRSLRAVFGTFAGALEEALTGPDGPERSEDGAILTREPVAATAEATTSELREVETSGISQTAVDPQDGLDIAQFITDLTAAFETALANLEFALQSATVLPALSEPRGNGVAYDKFLTVYEAMRAGGTMESPTSSQIETEA